MKKHYFLLFMVAVFVLLIYVLRNGICLSPDTTNYSNWADELINYKFNFGLLTKNQTFHTPLYLYAGFICLVSLSKVIAGASWPYLIVGVNIILSALTAIMLSYLVYALTKDKFSVWITFILYIFNPEIVLWSRYVLSDISFMFVNFSTLFLFALSCLSQKRMHRHSYMFIFTLMVFLNACYRPTGLVMIPTALAGIYLWKTNISDGAKKYSLSWGKYFALVFLFIAIAIILHAILLKNFEFWPFDFAKAYYKAWIVKSYQAGAVVDARYHTYHAASSGIGGYILITLDKFIHFFYFADRLYSLKHNIINSLFFIPTYALFLFGLFSVVRRKISLAKKEPIVMLALLIVILFAAYHAMNLIDFDWRYRLPTMPYILLISSFGTCRFKRYLFKHREENDKNLTSDN